MSAGAAPLDTIGLDFGTTNSVLARPDAAGGADLIRFTAPDGPTDVFRSALCFWQEEDLRGALSHAAGPWAIAEFLDFPLGSRFLQSFKSIAAKTKRIGDIANAINNEFFGDRVHNHAVRPKIDCLARPNHTINIIGVNFRVSARNRNDSF